MVKILRELRDIEGLTRFQKEVLSVCAKIPFGKTKTYAQIARAVGRPKAYRAVGNALACNPFPFGRLKEGSKFSIPCHRVIRADGKIGGFLGKKEDGRKLSLILKECRNI